MKKVITTVGTSVFTNYFDDEKNKNIDESKKTHYERLKNKAYSELENCKKRIGELKPVISNWVKVNENASAEIKSLIKIGKMLNDNLDVYLLTSDTILSNVATEIIEEYFEEIKGINIQKIIRVKEFQVKNPGLFSREGLVNLIDKIEEIANQNYDNVIFNITGGYKAVIPYIAIMAQINQCDIYYIFEDTDALIKIPKTPIRVDYDEIEENYYLLKELENGINNYPQWKEKNYARIEKINGFIDTDGEIAFLSPIGRIFLSKYEQKYFIFYAPDNVWENIQKKKDIERVLATKFWSKNQRDNQSEWKSNRTHLVFDDGNNQNRIFYFEEGGNIYIYKLFTDHDKYTQYLENNAGLSKNEREQLKKESKQRKIEIRT